jgi:hypothetical protein
MADLDAPEFAQGWVNDPQEVEAVVALQPYKTFSDTEAGKFMAASDLPENVYLWDAARKVLGGTIPPRNQGKVGSCFAAGTKIRMADGSHKNIEDIRLNDLVLTAEGNIGKVTTTFLRTESNRMVKFKCHGHMGLEATEEHPILTERGYVNMADLKVGDYIAVPKYAPASKTVIETSAYRDTYIPVRKEKAGRVHYGAASNFGRKVAYSQLAPMPASIELDPTFGRVLGLFLAEGSCDGNKVVWTFNIDEADTLANSLVADLRNLFDVEASLRLMPEKNTSKVSLHGREFSNLFQKLCGTGSGVKRLHADLTQGPVEFLEAVFRAWLDGDGYSRGYQTQGTTVSPDLALNMFDIANKLGLSPTLRKSTPGLSRGVKSRKVRYDVLFSSGEGRKPKQDDKVMWRKVTEIESFPYSGDVFNFEVQGDNSYVANAIGVHNCVAFGCCRAVEYTMLAEITAGENEEFRDLCTEVNYGGGRIEVGKGRLGRGDGSIGAWSAEFVKRWGSIDRAEYGKYDLRKYSEERCRAWGASGVPDDLEPEVKKYPISTITLVTTVQEAKKALAAGYGISVASDQGFSYTRDSNGICAPRGSWAHQMCICGYAKINGATYFRIDNSWGASTHTGPVGPGNPGPEGFYAAESVIARMLAQKDSFAYAGMKGFVPRNIIDWFV